jgi:hypothetical protein
MATNKQELLDEIKSGRLHKLYFKPNDTIPRQDIEQEVNATGEATDRLMDLQKRIKEFTMRETDWPQELRKDADELRSVVQSSIVRLYADSKDGTISNADFKEYFTPLAGMTEGLIAALSVDDPDRMMTLRSMREECRAKPFWRQLRKVIIESRDKGASDRTRFFQLAKAINSFNTHLFIGAEHGGHLPTGLVEDVSSIVDSLNKKASRGVWDYSSELGQIEGWDLVEGKAAGKPDTTTPGMPDGDERWEGDKDGKGAKAETTPPQLVRAPGNPKDEPEGEQELEQDEGGMEKGMPSKIDGKPAEPKVESVQFLVRIPKSPSFMEWNIHCGKKIIGEAWRHAFLGGQRLHAVVHASDLFKVLNEDGDVPGDGIKTEASDIYSLQTRVIEALNRLAAQLKQPRRFRLVRD